MTPLFKSCYGVPPIFWQMLAEGMVSMKKVALLLLPPFYTIKLLYTFTKLSLLGEDTTGALHKSIVDTLLVAVFLAFYDRFFWAFDAYLIVPLCDMLHQKQVFEGVLARPEAPGNWSLLGNMAKWVIWRVFQLIAEGAIGTMMHMTRSFTIIIFCLLGPLPVVASLLPGAKGMFKFWFKTTLSVFCWGIVLAMLDAMFIAAQKSSFIDMWTYVVLAVMYLSVPSITSVFLNSMGSGSALTGITNFVGLARMAAAMTGSKAALMVSGASIIGKSLIPKVFTPKSKKKHD